MCLPMCTVILKMKRKKKGSKTEKYYWEIIDFVWINQGTPCKVSISTLTIFEMIEIVLFFCTPLGC